MIGDMRGLHKFARTGLLSRSIWTAQLYCGSYIGSSLKNLIHFSSRLLRFVLATGPRRSRTQIISEQKCLLNCWLFFNLQYSAISGVQKPYYTFSIALAFYYYYFFFLVFSETVFMPKIYTRIFRNLVEYRKLLAFFYVLSTLADSRIRLRLITLLIARVVLQMGKTFDKRAVFNHQRRTYQSHCDNT